MDDVADVAYPDGFKGPRYLALIKVFGDESYDGETRVYSVAVFMAPSQVWKKVTRDWARTCRLNGVPYYYAADCEGGFGNFKHLCQPQRKELNTLMIDHLVKHRELAGIGITVYADAYQELMNERPEETTKYLGDSPYYFAMQIAVQLAAKGATEELGEGYRLAFVFEENEEVSGTAKKIYDQIKVKNPQIADCMGTLTYAPKEKFVPLQVADKLVYETMKNVLNQRFDPGRAERIALTRLKEAKKISLLAYIDKKGLENTIEIQKRVYG